MLIINLSLRFKHQNYTGSLVSVLVWTRFTISEYSRTDNWYIVFSIITRRSLVVASVNLKYKGAIDNNEELFFLLFILQSYNIGPATASVVYTYFILFFSYFFYFCPLPTTRRLYVKARYKNGNNDTTFSFNGNR